MINLSSKHIAEAIGVFAVVSSLLFVGMQLMLDRRIAAADQYSNRAELRIMTLQSWLESERYLARQASIWNEGYRPDWWSESLESEYEFGGPSSSNIVVDLLATEMDLLTFDNVYYQYQQGLLEEDFWNSLRNMYKQRLSDPQTRELTLNTAVLLPVHEIIAEIVNE